jgi:3-oxoadipate enol-lactonase
VKPAEGWWIVALAILAATTADARRHGPPRPTSTTQTRPAVVSMAEAARPTLPRRSGFATASDGVRLYYEVSGAGPAIVFVHGLGGNHAVWFHQVADFAVDHTVVTMSQRGFAPSDDAPSGYDPGRLALDLENVLDAALVRRAVVVGQSMGGWPALRFALTRPDRVEALVLADTPAGIRDEEIVAHLSKMVESASRLRTSPPSLGSHPALSPGFSRAHPAEAILYQTLTTFGSPPPATIAGQLAAAGVSPTELRGLRTPTLFVIGSEDTVFPAAILLRASSYVPGARIATVEGTGHSPYFEKPEAWNAALRDFLDEPRAGPPLLSHRGEKEGRGRR